LSSIRCPPPFRRVPFVTFFFVSSFFFSSVSLLRPFPFPPPLLPARPAVRNRTAKCRIHTITFRFIVFLFFTSFLSLLYFFPLILPHVKSSHVPHFRASQHGFHALNGIKASFLFFSLHIFFLPSFFTLKGLPSPLSFRFGPCFFACFFEAQKIFPIFF